MQMVFYRANLYILGRPDLTGGSTDCFAHARQSLCCWISYLIKRKSSLTNVFRVTLYDLLLYALEVSTIIRYGKVAIRFFFYVCYSKLTYELFIETGIHLMSSCWSTVLVLKVSVDLFSSNFDVSIIIKLVRTGMRVNGI
jgi:hypothetical protein